MKINNKFIRSIIVLILAFITGFAVLAAVNRYVCVKGEKLIADFTQLSEEQGDAILILGALVYDGGIPSPMLADRLDTGYELYVKKVAPKIIVSGDHGDKSYNEVRAMCVYLENKGVPREDIFMDHAGFDTYDSLYRARDIFECKRLVVVTQKFHLIRAMYIAQGIGLEAVGVSSDLRGYYGIRRNWLREYAARPKAFYDVLFKSKPKYLGEAIPISGSGLATEDGLS